MGPTDPSDNKPSGQEQLKPYLKYSGMAAQMIVILVAAALGGRKLDAYFEMKHPVFTIVLMLTGVIAAMYIIVSSVLKNK